LIRWFRNSQVLADWSTLLNLGILISLTVNTAQQHIFGTSVIDLKHILFYTRSNIKKVFALNNTNSYSTSKRLESVMLHAFMKFNDLTFTDALTRNFIKH